MCFVGGQSKYKVLKLPTWIFLRPGLFPGHPPTEITLMMPAPSASKCLYPQSLFGTGNTNALRLNVYFPCPLLCIEALTRTRFGINRVSVSGGLQAGSVQLSNEQELSKEPKSDTRQISNLTRVPLSLPLIRQQGLCANPCRNFLFILCKCVTIQE